MRANVCWRRVRMRAGVCWRVCRCLKSAFRATGAWRAWADHTRACAHVDPAANGSNARCWRISGSNFRAVYDAMVTHKRRLPPLVTRVYLKQRRVVYRSVLGPVHVWIRPAVAGALSSSDGWTVVVDGNDVNSQVPRWVHWAWAAERVFYVAVEKLALAAMTNRHRHKKRTAISRALYHLS